MKLELTQEEEELLGRILTSWLSDLRMEVSSTDSYDFRQGLKHEEEILKKIIADLRAQSGTALTA